MHSTFNKADTSRRAPNSVQQSPSSEAKRSSAIKAISRILWNPKVHCCIHNSPPFVPIQNQINSIDTTTLLFSFKTHLLLLNLGPPRGLSFRFTHRALRAFSFTAMRATCPVHLILIDLITFIIYLKAYKSQ